MKWTMIVWFAGMSCFAQVRYTDMKISQNAYPDVSIKATTLVTKLFLKRSDDGAWHKVYEAEVALLKAKEVKEAKKREQRKAQTEARRLMALDQVPVQVTAPVPVDTLPPSPQWQVR